MARQSEEERGALHAEREGSRPEPPAYLSAHAAEEWRALVALKPAGFFDRGTWALLAEHCELVSTWRWHSEQIAALRKQAEDKQGVDIQLLGFHEQQRAQAGAKLGNVDTKLRLTKQATSSKDKGQAAPQGRAPWETRNE
jgi:phage terminase small subunit